MGKEKKPYKQPGVKRHYGLEETPFSNVWRVVGTWSFYPAFTVTRNMYIVKHPKTGDLSLVNTVRVSPQLEKQIEALGPVKNLIRIGAFHGADDPYYFEKYKGVKVFAPIKTPHKIPEMKTDVELDEDSPDSWKAVSEALGFPCKVFRIKRAKFAETLLFAKVPLKSLKKEETDDEVIFACDGLQNWTPADFKQCSALGRFGMRKLGFGGPMQIGKPFVKFNTQPEVGSLYPDFLRLYTFSGNWKHLLSAHGRPLVHTARDDLDGSLKQRFGAEHTTPQPETKI